jgi:hypothetical protein
VPPSIPLYLSLPIRYKDREGGVLGGGGT